MQIEMLKGAQDMGEMNGIIYPRWHKLTQERVLHTRQFIITIRNSSCGKVVLYACLWFCSQGGVCLWVQGVSGSEYPRRPLQRRVRILLECILVPDKNGKCIWCKLKKDNKMRIWMLNGSIEGKRELNTGRLRFQKLGSGGNQTKKQTQF